ncbi:MAG: BrnT family toxin [Gemmatimonadaceae bacterium]
MTDDILGRLALCDSFEWDDGNAPKVRARHAVEPGECEQVFFGAPLLVSADARHSQVEERWRALGMTLSGRTLYLVFTLRGSSIRVLAARNMNRKERRDYEQAKARAEKDSDV